jgi:cytochrome oxidase Cu insertion factor (SCO1/SenC/PrrC family)
MISPLLQLPARRFTLAGVKAWILSFMAIAALGCRPAGTRTSPAPNPNATAPRPAIHQPALVLSGSFSDGTPLTLANLHGRPWVVNLWLPG